MSDILLINQTDPAITILTLNRPEKRNALNIALIESLLHAVEAAARDANRRAIILHGAGTMFCAGLDLDEATDASVSERSARSLTDLFRAIYESPLVTIAAAHGTAVGGGSGLIAACDLAVLADDMRLAYPEVQRGLVPALVACLLRRQLGRGALAELLLLGRPLSAAQAVARGLANRVAPASALLDAAIGLAREASQGAPRAIAQTKAILNRLDPLAPDLEAALQVHLAARASDESIEGIAAFREKRPPRWVPSRP